MEPDRRVPDRHRERTWAIYAKSVPNGEPTPAVTDDHGKKPGDAANVHEAPMPKPPAADATDPRKD